MSAASTPAPRANPPPPRHTLFWPMFIFLIGFGTLTIYQVMTLEDRLDEVTRAVDKIDTQVKVAEHNRNLFYALGRDVLALAPKDPNAEAVVVSFKLRELRAANPTRFDMAPTKPSETLGNPVDTVTASGTNSEPIQPLETATTPPANPAFMPGK